MTSFLPDVVDAIAASSLREAVVWALMNVPGLPPLLQSAHILAIAVLVASVMMVHMRVLGIAATGQQLDELILRSRPWTLVALTVLLCSGLAFVIARPGRYLLNPVFGIKLAALVPALVLAWVVQRRCLAGSPVGGLLKSLSGLALLLWVLVIFAGRWIAYVDYLFWEA